MTVAVAHHGSGSIDPVLVEAVRLAHDRGETLAVVHVREVVDEDLAAAVEAGVAESLQRAAERAGVPVPTVDLRVVVAASHGEVAAAVLAAVDAVAASVLVIGARHRSPVGKAFLGSVSQTLILDAAVPVLVVKPPR